MLKQAFLLALALMVAPLAGCSESQEEKEQKKIEKAQKEFFDMSDVDTTPHEDPPLF